MIEPWLTHQRRDGYWQHGSVCEDYAAIDCPVLLAGGWADGYRNAVLRMLEGLTCPRKAVIGPWSHHFPNDEIPPGPAIGFLQECVRWWDHWLKGESTRRHGRADAAHLDPGRGAAATELRRAARTAGWPSRRGPRLTSRCGR